MDMENKKKRFKDGFTLIELVIVIAIIGIMALILVPTIGRYTDEANKVKEQESIRTLYTDALLLNSQLPQSSSAGVRKKALEDSFISQGIQGVAVELDDKGAISSLKYEGKTTLYDFNGRIMKEFAK